MPKNPAEKTPVKLEIQKDFSSSLLGDQKTPKKRPRIINEAETEVLKILSKKARKAALKSARDDPSHEKWEKWWNENEDDEDDDKGSEDETSKSQVPTSPSNFDDTKPPEKDKFSELVDTDKVSIEGAQRILTYAKIFRVFKEPLQLAYSKEITQSLAGFERPNEDFGVPDLFKWFDTALEKLARRAVAAHSENINPVEIYDDFFDPSVNRIDNEDNSTKIQVLNLNELPYWKKEKNQNELLPPLTQARAPVSRTPPSPLPRLNWDPQSLLLTLRSV
jgi:hypothetical protein